MVRRSSLQEIREQTYKVRDAWWTVLLVDPLAARLVRLVAPYRWITPNLLTGLATLLGVAAAACFVAPGLTDQNRWWLAAGAALFHLSFVVDCMDGKVARLNGTGSLFGAWFDFMFDRLRVFMCAVALFGGQFLRTDEVGYLWTLIIVTFLDLFRYVNSQQMTKTRETMRASLEEVRGPLPPAESEAAVNLPPQGPRARLRAALLRHRIRTHLVSGIEFEMAVFIIGPLTGWIIGTSLVAGALMVAFELLLIVKLWRATRGFPVALAKAQAAAALLKPGAPAQASAPGADRVSAT
ncbi:CDP-alcohol phosphatidyltransferase family protein [Actinoplanes friuliensis]|uniref:CDP-alcohol phosphatidyltransferase n=1 Tax=Actinoplanes friuliensis DSM 7358 TaxID=1246995 RepID=U5W7M5_9ACTN|nr:CDP-alcohol phosphatidyltransferase family protein [Actinoplanes friuliensis]AGZ45193.1 hypothetical protein AFR_34685 [Actinoplanes friuliensis DSM 7358]